MYPPSFGRSTDREVEEMICEFQRVTSEERKIIKGAMLHGLSIATSS